MMVKFDILDKKIIQCLADDCTTADIAARIFCSESLVKNRIGQLKRCWGKKTRAGLLWKLVQKKILYPADTPDMGCPLKRYGSGLGSLL